MQSLRTQIKSDCLWFISACANEVDLLFILDASGSIGEKNFITIKNFVSYIIGNLDVESANVRVGALSFSTRYT